MTSSLLFRPGSADVYEQLGPQHAAQRDLHEVILGVVLEIARRSEEYLPGLVEAVTHEMVLVLRADGGIAQGWFSARGWKFKEQYKHGLCLNLDRRVRHPSLSRGASVVLTAAHELVHLWDHERGIRDTDDHGSLHLDSFALTADGLGLRTVSVGRPVGAITPGFTEEGAARYADLIETLDDTLVLLAEPERDRRKRRVVDPVKTAAEATITAASRRSWFGMNKQVTAGCQCVDARGRRRIVRMSKAAWANGSVICWVCRYPFDPRNLANPTCKPTREVEA